jgi:hypothetical protein
METAIGRRRPPGRRDESGVGSADAQQRHVCLFFFVLSRLEVLTAPSPRLYYLTRLGENTPEICPGFFQVDLVPHICKFLFRVEGECSTVV